MNMDMVMCIKCLYYLALRDSNTPYIFGTAGIQGSSCIQRGGIGNARRYHT